AARAASPARGGGRRSRPGGARPRWRWLSRAQRLQEAIVLLRLTDGDAQAAGERSGAIEVSHQHAALGEPTPARGRAPVARLADAEQDQVGPAREGVNASHLGELA